jgi:predicted permease
MTPVQLANLPPQPLNLRPLAVIERVTPSYFHTLEDPLKRGREFSAQDVAGAPPTAIINERLARVLWPSYPSGVDPVGQRILIGVKTDAQIIAIVGDMHQALETDPRPEVFRPFAQSPVLSAAFAVRTAGDPLHFVHDVSDQALAVDRDQPVSQFKSMDDLMEAEGGQRRLLLQLLGCFACAALLLTVFGIYGVVAYSVEQRTREVGIRMALGANQRELLRMVIGQGVKLVLLGVAIGVVASLALTRLLASLLFGVTAHDPLTIAGVATLLVLVALAACYVPARRATKVDPMVALRYE